MKPNVAQTKRQAQPDLQECIVLLTPVNLSPSILTHVNVQAVEGQER
jgi:hypothetical protein